MDECIIQSNLYLCDAKHNYTRRLHVMHNKIFNVTEDLIGLKFGENYDIMMKSPQLERYHSSNTVVFQNRLYIINFEIINHNLTCESYQFGQ